MTDEQVKTLVQKIGQNFSTFGGGKRPSGFNPIEAWTKNKPLMFAMGVDVEHVVRYVLVMAENEKP